MPPVSEDQLDESTQSSKLILFADVVDSTRLYQNLGDQPAQELIGEGITILKDIVEQYNGEFIKTIGDEIMAEFHDVPSGVEASVFMLKMLQNLAKTDEPEWAMLHIKIGLHFGPVIEKENDVFGNAVNIAARIVGQAKDSQILVTQPVVDHMTEEFDTRYVDSVSLKGIKGKTDIHEVIFVSDDNTSTTAILDDDVFAEFQNPKAEQKEKELYLKIGDRIVAVNFDYDRVRMGRSPDNEVVIDKDGVSRVHAKIEYKGGKYILSDNSTNGTFVVLDDGTKFHLRRDEMTLKSSGRIALGHPNTDEEKSTIRFDFSEE